MKVKVKERLLPDLRPEMIAGIYGRSRKPTKPACRVRTRGAVRATLTLLVLAVVTALAYYEKALLVEPGPPWALSVLLRPREITVAQLPLLGDPVSIVLLLAALATPYFSYRQVVAISWFVEMNETNVSYRAGELKLLEVTKDIERANRNFRIIGTRTVSFLILAAAAASSWFVLDLLETRGLYASWNNTPLTDDQWRQVVYEGWWAGRATHPWLAWALLGIGTYFFYFLIKQLLMGATFARFARKALHHEFGVTQSLDYNRDGYWGLRELRYFMQWTYLSTITHFMVTLGVFVVWLPFQQWTILVVIGVMIINFMVVFYPSQVAFSSSVQEKRRFVQHTFASVHDAEERDRLIERAWSTPNLPFRLRSTLSAATLYLLIPLTLAIVSTVLSRA